MSDRELLELAAKAAGFGAPDSGAVCWTESEYPRGSGRHGALWNYVGHMEAAELWNPLADDGDALRLAAIVGVCVDHDEHIEVDFHEGIGGDYALGVEAWKVLAVDSHISIKEVYGAERFAATRRAIVRAAAEIGRST